MKARDVFGIIIRVGGLTVTVLGLWYLVYAFAELFGLPEQTPGEMRAYFAGGGPYTAVGLLVLRYARQIVRFSYPGNRDDSDLPPA